MVFPLGDGQTRGKNRCVKGRGYLAEPTSGCGKKFSVYYGGRVSERVTGYLPRNRFVERKFLTGMEYETVKFFHGHSYVFRPFLSCLEIGGI